MSVGAWTLTAFGTFASAALFADEMRKRTHLPVQLIGDASAILSAATGLVMATYTGVLIGATAIPVWSKHVSVLPLHFGTSALASAVSMLELAGHNEQALNILGLAAAAIAMLILGRSATSLLYGVTPLDPAAITGALLLVLLTAVAASSIPARRASRLSPIIALRHE